jgi:F-type H+-transporting ATPase subunit b
MFHTFAAVIFLAESGESFFETYINRPGFELWKFFNLLLFIGVLYYILRRPLGEAMAARRAAIRRELLKAQEERNAALAKLQEVEERLARLNDETEALRKRAQIEAEQERERMRRATEEEIRKLRDQAQREIEMQTRMAQQELRRYAAEQSVRFAEEMIRQEITPQKDAQLAARYVASLGGVQR